MGGRLEVLGRLGTGYFTRSGCAQVVALSCGHADAASGTDTSTETDADTDTDSDIDADADTDADTDKPIKRQ